MRIRAILLVLVGTGVSLSACGGAVGGNGLFGGEQPDSGLPPGCTEVGCFDAAPDRSVVRPVPTKHRPAPTTCDGVRPNTEPDIGDGGRTGQCARNADCTAGRNGRCTFGRGGPVCSYDQCTTDSECTKGVCECSGGFAASDICLQEGNCRVDAECGANGYCSPTLGSCGHYTGFVGYYCHTAQDECVNDEDCAGVDGGWSGQRAYCAFERTVGRWRCSTQECAG